MARVARLVLVRAPGGVVTPFATIIAGEQHSAVLTPTVRVNEFGVKAYPPDLYKTVTGHRVIVRDWYGQNELACTGVTLGRNGYPSALKFTRPDGRPGEFSLFTALTLTVL